MARKLVGYSDVLPVLEGLRYAVQEARRRGGLSLRAAAARSGVSFNAISRFERGHDITLSAALKLIRWLANDGGVTTEVDGD